MKWLTLLILLLPTSAFGDAGFFVEGGVAYHSMSDDCPEYCGRNPLFDIGAGYTFELDDTWEIDAYVKHRSSAPDVEVGYGHNLLGVRIRWYLGGGE